MADSFTYTSFRVADDGRTVSFEYLITHTGEQYRLTEQLIFPIKLKNTTVQQASLRALHLILGVSYFKIFLAPLIKHPYAMSASEAEFWNTVWRHGFGEFLFVNKLPADQLARFAPQDGEKFEVNADSAISTGALLGIGGGKDSIVAGELLKALDVPLEGFVMATGEQRGQAQAVADTMGVPLQVVNRTIDKQLLDLQEQPGAYKGHIPVSVIFALVGTALAIASDKSYVVVANEASASIPRLTWQDASVNHQWSKSFVSEQGLQQFVHKSVTPSVTYFSAIRQLTSVGVAKLFANYNQYFEVFTSDNFVFRIDPARRPSARWSLESPKSLSSFILLSPWLSEADMLRTFSLNFLDEASLEQLFLELTGLEGHPPLDCVGTVEELILSLNLAAQQGKFADSYLMKIGRDRKLVVDKDWKPELTTMLALQPDQVLPANLESRITEYFKEKLAL